MMKSTKNSEPFVEILKRAFSTVYVPFLIPCNMIGGVILHTKPANFVFKLKLCAKKRAKQRKKR